MADRPPVSAEDPMAPEMDDAVHIAAPWEPRYSLCGYSRRMNLVTLDGERPDGMAGCWTCLMAAEWMDRRLVRNDEATVESEFGQIAEEVKRALENLAGYVGRVEAERDLALRNDDATVERMDAAYKKATGGYVSSSTERRRQHLQGLRAALTAAQGGDDG